MKFHGESDSDSPWVALYSKIISFGNKIKSKWKSTGPYILPVKGRGMTTPPVRPPVRPSARPPVRSSARPTVRASVRSSVRPSILPSARPSFRPSFLQRDAYVPQTDVQQKKHMS